MPPKQQWNVLVWNIQGINSDDKLLAIRNAIETCGCDVICLQETKRMHLIWLSLKPFVLNASIILLMFLHVGLLGELLLFGMALCLMVQPVILKIMLLEFL